MAELIVCKADPIVKTEPTAGCVISITADLPNKEPAPTDYTAWLAESHRRFDEEAKHLEEALYGSLPGGTYDRLLGRMLARKSTHFAVAHEAPEATP